MTQKTLTYRDIPRDQRQAAATKALIKLRERLTDPSLTQEQIDAVLARVMHLNSWSAGLIDVVAAEPPGH
jgi:hypothetical protein